MKSLISVIVPCYNYSHFLPETLDSIITQSYFNWECIIVDDGSTDNTKEITQKYILKDKRIRYIFQVNQGLSGARNTGILNSYGEYIQLLDADDLITSDKFKIQVEAFKKNSHIDVIYGEYLCFDNIEKTKTWKYSRGTFLGHPAKDIAAHWEKGLSIPIHSFLYKKICFDRWGLFDQSFIYGKEDWDLHLNFAISGVQYLFVPGLVALYRVSAKSMVRDTKKTKLGKKLLIKKYLSRTDIPITIWLIFMMRYVDNFDIILKVRKLFSYIKKYQQSKFLSF